MEALQIFVTVKPPGNSDLATVKTAKVVTTAVTGKRLPRAREKRAGSAVHYLFGAAVGGLYGGLAELWPVATHGVGIPFGLAVSAAADELLVPALGLGAPPWKSSPRLHAYGAASHIIFGAITEAVRRGLRKLF